MINIKLIFIYKSINEPVQSMRYCSKDKTLLLDQCFIRYFIGSIHWTKFDQTFQANCSFDMQSLNAFRSLKGTVFMLMGL